MRKKSRLNGLRIQPQGAGLSNSHRYRGRNCVVLCEQNCVKLPRATSLRKEETLNTMKLIAIITLAAAAISLSACAHKDDTMASTAATKSTYSK